MEILTFLGLIVGLVVGIIKIAEFVHKVWCHFKRQEPPSTHA